MFGFFSINDDEFNHLNKMSNDKFTEWAKKASFFDIVKLKRRFKKDMSKNVEKIYEWKCNNNKNITFLMDELNKLMHSVSNDKTFVKETTNFDTPTINLFVETENISHKISILEYALSKYYSLQFLFVNNEEYKRVSSMSRNEVDEWFEKANSYNKLKILFISILMTYDSRVILNTSINELSKEISFMEQYDVITREPKTDIEKEILQHYQNIITTCENNKKILKTSSYLRLFKPILPSCVNILIIMSVQIITLYFIVKSFIIFISN